MIKSTQKHGYALAYELLLGARIDPRKQEASTKGPTVKSLGDPTSNTNNHKTPIP